MSALSPRATAVVYQVASRTLDYPDEQLLSDIPMMRAALREVPASFAAPLGRLLDHIAAAPTESLAADYVATFDLRRRCCLYLSYYAYGDTRKRGVALLAFKQSFRRGKVELSTNELPDHLCVVLEFAATADLARGRKMLLEHRAGLEMLRLALQDGDSPWADGVAAVTATLPALQGEERRAVARLAAEGPPGEEVGLEPFAPPDVMGAHA
jgi:nitrate reductase delta subunit